MGSSTEILPRLYKNINKLGLQSYLTHLLAAKHDPTQDWEDDLYAVELSECKESSDNLPYLANAIREKQLINNCISYNYGAAFAARTGQDIRLIEPFLTQIPWTGEWDNSIILFYKAEFAKKQFLPNFDHVVETTACIVSYKQGIEISINYLERDIKNKEQVVLACDQFSAEQQDILIHSLNNNYSRYTFFLVLDASSIARLEQGIADFCKFHSIDNFKNYCGKNKCCSTITKYFSLSA